MQGAPGSPQEDGLFVVPGLGEKTMMGTPEVVESSVWAATADLEVSGAKRRFDGPVNAGLGQLVSPA